MAEYLVFAKGGVLLSGAEQEIRLAVEETVGSSAGCSWLVRVLSSKNTGLDRLDNKPHTLILHNGFAIIGIHSIAAKLGRQVDGLIPVFPPIFIDSFFLRFPAFRHSVAADLYAGFAFSGGGAAVDILHKGAFECVWMELARRQNGWHRHNEILLI